MYCKNCGTLLQNGVCPKCRSLKKAGTIWAALAVFPALLPMLLFLVNPILKTILLSFKNYSPARGIIGSAWVGFANYSEFLSSSYFPNLLGNSLIQGILCLLAGTAAVFLLTYAIARIQNKWLRCGVLSVLLLPNILPHVLLLSLIPKALLTSPTLYRLVPVIHEAVFVAPLAVFAGSFLLTKDFSRKRVLFITLFYTALRLLLFMFPDLQLQLSTYNPTVYQTADVLGTFQYRRGFAESNYGISSVSVVMQLLLNFLPWILGAVLLGLLLFRFSFDSSKEEALPHSNTGALPAVGLMCGSFLAIILGVFFAFVATITMRTGLHTFGNLLLTLACCLSAATFAVGFSYPIIAGNKAVGITALCIIAIVLPLCGNLIGQYLQMRELGIINTLFAVMFQNATGGIWGALGLVLATSGKTESGGKSLFRQLLPPCIAFLCIGFCKFYAGTYLYSFIYIHDRNLYPLSLVLREISLSNLNNVSANPTAHAANQIFVTTYLLTALVGIAGIWLSGLLTREEAR